MSDEIKKEVTEMTPEEKAAAWSEWVRSEVNAALDIYLDKALSGNINVKYFPHVTEVLETGPVFNTNKADGVLLSVEFTFEEAIDLTKPRIKEEETEE
jgi:hypothetical protein